MADKKIISKFSKTMALCFIAALILTITQVLLKEKQEKNRSLEIKAQILKAAEIEFKNEKEIEENFNKYITFSLYDIKKETKISTKDLPLFLNPKNYELQKIIKSKFNFKDKNFSNNRIPLYIPIYEVKHKNIFIFPIYGQGLWEKMFAFISIDSKTKNRVTSLIFYEHAETPGLGGQISDTKWQNQWKGKKLYNEKEELKLKNSKTKINNQQFHVDAISGATITSQGVNDMLSYWFKKNSFYYNFLHNGEN